MHDKSKKGKDYRAYNRMRMSVVWGNLKVLKWNLQQHPIGTIQRYKNVLLGIS